MTVQLSQKDYELKQSNTESNTKCDTLEDHLRKKKREKYWREEMTVLTQKTNHELPSKNKIKKKKEEDYEAVA